MRWSDGANHQPYRRARTMPEEPSDLPNDHLWPILRRLIIRHEIIYLGLWVPIALHAEIARRVTHSIMCLQKSIEQFLAG